MKTTIEIIPQYEIAYIRNTGPYGADNIQTMERLKTWAREKYLLNYDSIILGIAQDNPAVTKAEACRYDTCFVIAKEYEFDEEYVHRGKIMGGKYAIFEIKHTAEAIQKAWTEVFQKLNESGYSMDYLRPVLERYAARMVNNHKCEICIPIC